MAVQSITSRSATPAEVQRVDIESCKDPSKSVSVVGGTVRLQYWESILQDTVRASVIFTDAGNTLPEGDKKVSAVEGLPITGQEKVTLKFSDNNCNTLEFSKNKKNNLYVNKVTALSTDNDSGERSYELDLVSKEFIENEESRVNICLAGEISESVKSVLKDFLKSEKFEEENIEDTKQPGGEFTHIGNNKKPFYVMNELAKKAVSAKNQKEGDSAGYFLWETSKGFNFESIDTLLSQKQRKSIIYNETPDTTSKGIPKGYDIKALALSTDNRINVQKKLQLGAYSTKSELFNPFTTEWTTSTIDILSEEGEEKVDNEYLKLAGKNFPSFNKAFNEGKEGTNEKYSRTTFNFTTTGQLNWGDPKTQISKSKKLNFDYAKIFNQSLMRYNQLYASEITLTLPGDFSLHAGDTVFVDIPKLESETKNDKVNKEDGGLYIISDLCHFITSKETYTKLILIRDSFGRDGSPTKDKTPLC